VGYAGGTTANPSYYHIGDYSETVEVEYDPAIVSYEQLLAAFWNGQDATYPPYDTQYRSAIFYTSDQQQKLAREALQQEEARTGKKIYTDIEPYTSFYVAEDYHQKYYLKLRTELANELEAIYPKPADFADSTAVARLNGYAGGYGDEEALKKNINGFGLSESGQKALIRIAESGLTPGCPIVTPKG
jgi:peptide-methionine (S)-S-oxide reductase